MRFLTTLLVLAATTLGPLPGIDALPDASQVMVARDDLQSFIGVGTIASGQLSLQTQSGRLPSNERVVVWFVLPAKNAGARFTFPGRTTVDGTDVTLELPERVSLKKVLKDAYRIEFRLAAKK